MWKYGDANNYNNDERHSNGAHALCIDHFQELIVESADVTGDDGNML